MAVVIHRVTRYKREVPLRLRRIAWVATRREIDMLKPTDKAAFLGVRNDIYDSAGKKSQEPLTFPACFRRDSLCGHLFRIESPDVFYVGRYFVDADHEPHLLVGVVGVSSWV